MPPLSLKIFFLILLLLLMPGCVCLKHPMSPLTLQNSAISLKPDDIVDTRRGTLLSFETLIEELAAARVIYVGETHTSVEDHRIQLKVAEALYHGTPSLILAMETFPRQAQPILDQYSGGVISEEAFLKEVDWNKVWGYPFRLYRPILAWANERHLKIIGLNAPSEVVRKIAQSGLSSLMPEERKLIASHIDFGDLRHKEYLEEEYAGHLKESIKDFQTFYEAQLAWEETMAETMAETSTSFRDGEQIIVLIGSGHIVYRFGVPQRAWNRAPDPYKTIVAIPEDSPERTIDPEIADYVWITQKQEVPHRGRLGIMVRALPEQQGVEVIGVLSDSPAAKAGIQKNDIISEMDGKAVFSLEDLHDAVAGKRTAIQIKLRRGDSEVSVSVHFHGARGH